MHNTAALIATLVGLAVVSPASAEVPRVVASIKPIQSLVASVMGDLGTPALIVSGSASPHTYSLKPSDAAALQHADLVFWTGHGLELFLADSIGNLAPGATIVELADTPGLTLLPPREAGTFEPHEDGDEEGNDHGHGEEVDMHFFLDPQNAELLTRAIAAALVTADPEHEATYTANAEATVADLAALITETQARLAPIADRPIVVFHDAYQYFGTRFGLDIVGSVTVTPEIAPGADRITRIREKLASLGAACVFAEPQFDPRIVDVLTEGTGAKAGVLDPEGANLDPGPGLYRKLIENLAAGVLDCVQ